MNEVYVIAGGEWLRNNLNAIAAFMSTRTWDSIEKIALTLSVLAVAVMWVQRHNVMDLLGWVAVFVLISLLVNVRTSVQIIDNSDLVQVHRVDNVPVGLAVGFHRKNCAHIVCSRGGRDVGTAAQRDGFAGLGGRVCAYQPAG
ncbi:conjugal transfer protein TraG N-terminal domain-containing protein [Escherichia coli]|uniref:conjugal transfer protein TraG N-terminal domain-containing protein n=1 Tax=Escherichia coli TaxID=562 RepID=UPI000F49D0C2